MDSSVLVRKPDEMLRGTMKGKSSRTPSYLTCHRNGDNSYSMSATMPDYA